MAIDVKQTTYIDSDNYDTPYSIEISIDGSVLFRDFCGEPEDNTYCRDHSCVVTIIDLLQTVYEMGRSGKDVMFTDKTVKDN